MGRNDTRIGAGCLERSCRALGGDWVASSEPGGGITLLRAWFGGVAYARHRHDTYAIGVTDSGVQVFDYRGATQISTPGQVALLYPDEAHDGRAGTAEGFGYRIIYVDPAQLSDALRAVYGSAQPLPFTRQPVVSNPVLARVVAEAFLYGQESLAIESLLLDLAAGLLAEERRGGSPVATQRVDTPAIERARQFLDSELTRVVRTAELETITGLTRFELARQFRRRYGTTPYRYLLMRRLALARQLVHQGRTLGDIAYEAGFADQAHFTRMFKSAFGLTPARYRALRTERG
jgi:AraC-like DNA-binding protein